MSRSPSLRRLVSSGSHHRSRARPFSSDAAARVPEHARVVVCGGGIIGSSIAYHLAGMYGWGSDVVLLERDQIASGTTWHAAGLMVTFGSTSSTSLEFRQYTKNLYSKLEEETGQSTGLSLCGFIELATNPDYLEDFRRVAAYNRLHGVECHEISPKEVQDLWPLARVDDVLAGFYVPDDGRVNPWDAAMALEKGARLKGAKVVNGVSATGVTTENGRITGVTTDCGKTIKCDYVVNAMGMWARQFGEKCGVTVPNQAAEHYYLITEPIPELDPKLPVLEDPSHYTYIRPEAGNKLMVGLFEAEAAAWNVKEIPGDFSFGEIEPDWERMTPFLEKAMSRVPISANVGMQRFFCGPESFTPDLAPLVGESPEIKNYFVCAGLNSIGILTGGGLGRLMAHWITQGKPDQDITGINVDRAHRFQANPQFRAERVVESLGRVYKCHYPNFSPKSARGVKKSVLHDRLAAKGAYFIDVSGWESPGWFAFPGEKPVVEKLSWGRENWFPNWEAEHKACRENVVIQDISFFSKFLVQGSDAGRILNRLSTANVDGDSEKITYTQWLNDDGMMEADLTITKYEPGKFLVVATDTMHRHVETMLRRAAEPGDNFTVTDHTSALAQLTLQGPRSRELLQKLTTEDLSNANFSFRTSREIDIGLARVQCSRITYLGELGYELYTPPEMAQHVYDTIVEAGEEFGLKHIGLKALGSLRMEKAYKDYGHDMDNLDSPLELGLGFACDFDKPGGFVGKDKVVELKAGGVKALKRRLVQVLVKDPEPLMYHAEVLYRDGQPCGDIRAASYGHTLGGAVGLSMVEGDKLGFPKMTKAWFDKGTWEVDIAGRRYPAVVSLAPMYDPTSERVKAETSCSAKAL